MSAPGRPDRSRHDEPTLDEAQQRWNDFVDAIGHELRTPLTSIIGFQELLEDGIYGQLPETGRGALVRIGNSAQELLALLNGMVDLARPAQAPPELDLEDLPLDGVIADAIETGRRLAPDRDVRWSAEPASGLGTIRTDARRLQRALFLAILAAVRATPGGDIHLSVEPIDATGGGGAMLRLQGAVLERVPRPPLADIILDRPHEGADRSLLRLSLAVDTLALLGCTVDLEPGPPATLLVRLRSAPKP
ncbi:MAG TPA: HAMP domain-containing sensor histidine kinase [Longimicrobiales bacterium]|nr:HAMP domain-containing sensor histidine kinase [Longimicrobiales bacterium]